MLSRLIRKTGSSLSTTTKMTNKGMLSKSFGLKFTKRTVIAPVEDPFIPYTREQIKFMKENPNYEQELREAEEKKQREQHEQLHFGNYSNDQNPANRITVELKVDQEYNPIDDEITAYKQDHPFTVFHTSKKPLPFITGTYGTVKGSVKKLKPTVRQMIGLHLYDAMGEMQESEKRASERLFNALNMVRSHAVNVGMEQDHLWVKSAELQMQKRRKSLYYHARGRFGFMKRDWCRVKITLEEKPVSEIYKMLIGGEAPKGLAKIWRDKIYEDDENLEVVRKFQFLVSAKGRQQRREMIRRKTHKLQDQFLVKKSIFFSQKFSEFSLPFLGPRYRH